MRGLKNLWAVFRRCRAMGQRYTHLISGPWAVVEGEVVRLNAGCGRRRNSSEVPIVCLACAGAPFSPAHDTASPFEHNTRAARHQIYHKRIDYRGQNYMNPNIITTTTANMTSHREHSRATPAASFGVPFVASRAKLSTTKVTFDNAYFCSVPNWMTPI